MDFEMFPKWSENPPRMRRGMALAIALAAQPRELASKTLAHKALAKQMPGNTEP